MKRGLKDINFVENKNINIEFHHPFICSCQFWRNTTISYTLLKLIGCCHIASDWSVFLDLSFILSLFKAAFIGVIPFVQENVKQGKEGKIFQSVYIDNTSTAQRWCCSCPLITRRAHWLHHSLYFGFGSNYFSPIVATWGWTYL